ncbi:hypothetical protein Pryu01_00474 [Paraliobacillus ryukyuensis]|uniref:Uncharacterized protein n=1 Tax=Paraliobacillus ryukyuensis TaxID=200904 RepID=A0A366EGJ6_9BACI|nr:hypothetical protein [Paraliobacillus ryukyuensis]RBP01453.1 hypothetical protein DES48_101190 [Paraliobacillus ryukyuensis]
MEKYIFAMHIFYFVIMAAAGAWYFYLLSRKFRGVYRYEYVIAIFMGLIADF